jgi:hypothetical protein
MATIVDNDFFAAASQVVRVKAARDELRVNRMYWWMKIGAPDEAEWIFSRTNVSSRPILHKDFGCPRKQHDSRSARDTQG